MRCHGLARNEQGNLRGPALANCREALARRQVLIERDALPSDYPIPNHLQELYNHETGDELVPTTIQLIEPSANIYQASY
jgi:hypothetical protein